LNEALPPSATVALSTDQLEAFVVALGIGLLIGLERERVASARAGLRTFGLVGLFGALTAFLGQHLGSVAPLVAGMLLVGVTIIAAHVRQPDPEDPGTTSVTALLVCYSLGALTWYGHLRLASMLAVGITVLLYFKTELKGIAARLTPKDWRSMLQFSVLSLVILPILPDQDYGPYGALNPHQIWLMVVLVAGVSLAGYAALQLAGARYGAPLVGILGGLVSSTATTLVYARNARPQAGTESMAALVILLANLVMLVRVTAIGAALAPAVLQPLSWVVGPALVLGLTALAVNWRQLATGGAVPLPTTTNPTELKTALGFGLLYGAVLFASAWLSDRVGNQGLYAVALASGLTDIDAISLSSLRLHAVGKISENVAATVIGLAMLANLGFKASLAFIVGGRELGLKVLIGMGAVAIGLALGIGAIHL
jgi:uncharacterized membrane protein (DUF4010 family)